MAQKANSFLALGDRKLLCCGAGAPQSKVRPKRLTEIQNKVAAGMILVGVHNPGRTPEARKPLALPEAGKL